MTATAGTETAGNTTISIRRTGVFLGAEITGVNLARPLNNATVEAIRQAHAEHGVLAFPG